MNGSQELTLFGMILLISIPGAFGGFAAALFDSYGKTDKEIAVWRLISRTLIGIAGAFGVVLIGFWVGKINAETKVLNQLFLISFSLIGGTISYKILPKIGTKLEEQLQLKLDETKREVTDTVDKKTAEATDYSAAMTSADTALTTQKMFDFKLAIEMLENIKSKFPINRSLNVKLGHLYKKIKNYNNAIIVNKNFIDELNKEHSTIGKNPHYIQDSADSYFNIACYHVLKAKDVSEKHGNPEEIATLVKEALEAFKISVELLPSNRHDAIEDEDFDFIRDNEEFKELIKIEPT